MKDGRKDEAFGPQLGGAQWNHTKIQELLEVALFDAISLKEPMKAKKKIRTGGIADGLITGVKSIFFDRSEQGRQQGPKTTSKEVGANPSK